MPRVAVLLPTYEPDPIHLREAVESVLAQSEADWTLLIRDDASNRDVHAMVQPFLTDPRVRFIRGERRLGIGGNWNACLQLADASAIQYLFQDDVWAPHALALGLEALNHFPSAGIVSLGHAYRFEGADPTAGPYAEIEREQAKLTSGLQQGSAFLRQWVEMGLRPNVIGEPSFVMVRRSVLENVGLFAEDMPQFLDADMWIRLLLVSDWARVTEDCGFFRVHAAAASARNEGSGKGLADRLEAFQRLIARLPKGELRAAAQAARNRALTDMAGKFLQRLRSGKAVAGAAGGGVRAFALRHPLLVVMSVLRALVR